MKAIINFSKRTNWFKASGAFFSCLLFLIIPSCQKDDSSFLTQKSLTRLTATAISTTTGILYYGHKTFTRTTGEPFVETQTIENPNFENFNSSFVLKVQNGSDKKTRVSSAEIRIDGVLIVGTSDFSKNVSQITKQISGLTPESILEVKLKSAPGSFIDLWIEGTLKEEMTVTDIDGNVYKTVTIGTQVWMAENLKTTKYNDGKNIPLVTANMLWSNLSTPAYCWYNNDAVTNKDSYGALYNWYTVNTGILCPVGYHVPTDWEMGGILTEYLGGWLTAGGKLKETGFTHWLSPNEGATNESGFTALPGGRRNEDGSFIDIGLIAHWWSTTELNETIAYQLYVYYLTPYFANSNNYKVAGYSVRCLKD